MQIASFSCKLYDRQMLCRHMPIEWENSYYDVPLERKTLAYAEGCEVITAFVNDRLDAVVLEELAQGGTKLIALRCAGFNHVDVPKAKELGLKVVRVPDYSPYAVAEHAIGLMLALNRRLYRAYNRIREGNFSLNGMLGFDMHGKTVGIIGAGKIGRLVGKMLKAFGCRILVYDPYECISCKDLGLEQVPLDELFAESDIVSLHCPLTQSTNHIINTETIAKMKKGVMLINTGRGALVDTQALIDGLKTRQIGYLGMDVYEKEGVLFFEDHSCEIIEDDQFERLVTLPNVLITGHQAYFTEEALTHIAETTIENIRAYEEGLVLKNEVLCG
ncbi:2-hydroxyacid dehydrogenase [Thiomicrorhabdus sp.]|uniref:2-hydroxyacid dehydrogenase n=1 Tax=Thiomicrorhabdus sp. TaxID=2039724 RepID=UPI0029C61CFE|nr:2-hydroxyacid dehydrogenase [Thiomicrorhabdus sp.]